jgi:6,7-dimethyl-8-ribityllumazine synthase
MTHILIINSRFYPEIADELSKGAVAALKAAGATYEEVEVSGAFEVPAAIRFAMNAKRFDGYVALGCVIRGETSHYDYVCGESARGLMELSLREQLAIGYGILTVETYEQAQIRADIREGNKGGGAAHTCLGMIALKKQFGGTA